MRFVLSCPIRTIAEEPVSLCEAVWMLALEDGVGGLETGCYTIGCISHTSVGSIAGLHDSICPRNDVLRRLVDVAVFLSLRDGPRECWPTFHSGVGQLHDSIERRGAVRGGTAPLPPGHPRRCRSGFLSVRPGGTCRAVPPG